MNTPSQEHEVETTGSAKDPIGAPPSAPSKVGVYDKPERQGMSPVGLILIVLLILLAAYLLWQFVF